MAFAHAHHDAPHHSKLRCCGQRCWCIYILHPTNILSLFTFLLPPPFPVVSFAPIVDDSNDTNPHLTWKEGEEFFPDIAAIKYEGPSSLNSLAYKHYNADEIINGKSMEQWLRFGVCFWHTFRGKGSDPFGAPTQTRPWDDESDTLANAFRRARAAFEFMTKLGVKYYTFHDRDIAPEGKNIDESNANLDAVVDLLETLQQDTGIRLLWSTQNLFSHPRYMNGGATNPDAHVFAYAASQAKKILEVNHRLGGENVVFWGGREGYQSVLNTDVKREVDHMAQFFKMCLAYRNQIGSKAQFLIEPKPREPTKHQYDYDAQTVIGFLHTYGLEKDFKLNIEPNHTTLAGHDYEHDILMSSKWGMLGSVDANTGDPLLGTALCMHVLSVWGWLPLSRVCITFCDTTLFMKMYLIFLLFSFSCIVRLGYGHVSLGH